MMHKSRITIIMRNEEGEKRSKKDGESVISPTTIHISHYYFYLPLLLGLPMPANHDPPRRMMVGTFTQESI